MIKTYFTSDWHFGHRNIVGPSISKWNSGYRTFGTVAEHDATIIEAINDTVPEDAKLYFLGDISFKGSEFIKEKLDQINCKNIIWLLGNHDTVGHKLFKKQLAFGDRVVSEFHPKLSALLNYMEIRIAKDKTTAEGLIASQLFPDNIILSHYPIGSWNGSFKGSWHLHGHSHNSYTPVGKMLDVTIDSAYEKLGEYRPFSFEEVARILMNKSMVVVDHHDENTNL